MEPPEGSKIQSLNGCKKIKHITRPMDPKCSNTDRVSDYTANSISLNLTGITVGNKTTHVCVKLNPTSKSIQNTKCVLKTLTTTTINDLQPGTSYTFTIYASIEQQEGSKIQSLNGCEEIVHFTRPMDPKCPNTERVLDYTANNITLNLTGITTDNKTTQLCVEFRPASASKENIKCVSKSLITTVSDLQPGTSYTFTIYASIEPLEGSKIQSLNGCKEITHFTRPMDPKCSNTKRVSNYTANNITLNLIGITTDNKTTHLCIDFNSASTLKQNTKCVSKALSTTIINNLQPGTSYTFTIYASFEQREDSKIQSVSGCGKITQITRPSNPECPNIDQRVVEYTANSITLNLTGIIADTKTTHLCVEFNPASTSNKNIKCVSRALTTTTINNLQQGTSYTFTIYASMEPPEGSKIQSLNGCEKITHFTNPLFNCSTISGSSSSLVFKENQMNRYNISINSTNYAIFQKNQGGVYDLSRKLDSGMNYTLSIIGEGGGGLWTQLPCKVNISTGISKPQCQKNFYEVLDTSLKIYPKYCSSTGVQTFNFVVYGTPKTNVSPTTDFLLFPVTPGTKVPITVTAFGRNGIPSASLHTDAYTKPAKPSCKSIDYETTSSVIDIKGSSFSAQGAMYFTVELLNHPNRTSVVHNTNTSTFEGLQAGQSYTFIVKAKSQHGELSYGNCSFVAFTRPNNPVCKRASISQVKTNAITLDLVSLNASGANAYLVTYNSSQMTKNITFGNNNLLQELKNLIPGTNYEIKIFSLGNGNFFSSKGCTLEEYTYPPAPQNATFEEDVSYISLQWDHEEGNVENYIIDINCSCEVSSCKQCLPKFNNSTIKSEANITELNPGSRCNISIVAVSGSFHSIPLILRLKSKEIAPGKVSSLNVSAVTTDSITLEWKEPDCPNGDITQYILSITTEKDKTEKITNISEFSYKYTNLKPGTFYNISVVAINSVDRGDVSFLHVYTVETVPSKVRNLVARNMTSTSIHISWMKPDPPNGVVNEYKVHIISNSSCIQSNRLTCQKCHKMYQDDAAFLKENTENDPGNMFEMDKSCIRQVQNNFTGSNISVTVYNLTFFTEYEVFVYAHTSKGFGANSSVTVFTSEDRPSRPTQLRGNASQHTIFLEFRKPKQPNGHIILLQIEYFYKTQNICLSEELEFEKRLKKIRINGSLMDPFTTKLEHLFSHWDYTIRVQMATYVGFGDYSKNITIRTKPDVPDVVRNIDIGTVSSRSINLQWEGPCQPNGIIEYFLIRIISEKDSRNVTLTTPSNNTSYNVTDLLPYRTYVFGISAKTVGVEQPGQSVESIAVNTSTEGAYKPRNVSFHTTPVSVFLNWKPPILQTGPTNYKAIATDSKSGKNTSSCSSTGFFNTSCTVKDLHPFWNYSITLLAITEPFSPNSTSISISTDESAPGRVAYFNVTQGQNLTAPREVMLSWMSPLEMDKNGIIQNYFIKYWVVDMAAEAKTISYPENVTSVTIKDILPEKEYIFQIFPATIANASENDYVSQRIVITAGVPIPIKLPKSIKAISLGPSSKVSDDEKQLSVSFNYRSLCNNTNGNPVSWFIIVAEQSTIPNRLSSPFKDSKENYEIFIKKEYKTWSSVHTQDHFDPYVAKSDWNPKCSKLRRHKRAAEEKTVSFLVGQQGECEGVTGYCNGYLKPGKKYRVRFAVCTREGCLESAFSTPLETKPNLVPAIAGSVSGVVVGLVVVIAVIILYLKRKRKGPFQDKSREIERGNDNENFSTELETRNVSKPRPVKIAQFAEHVQRMHADSNLLFSNEYKLLKETCPTHTTKAAEIQVNRIKNRYTNILAYDHSRIKLLPTEDDEGSDYINANYIPGYSSQREYIASQGPLPFTRDEFWRMIWEQNVSIIVMLTQLVERGRRKCDIYWPEATREPVYYGDLVVEIESESTLPDYVLRVMSVKLGDSRKTVKHFSYLAWPDMGIPETSESMLKFTKEVRSHLPPPTTNRGPLVVHCSAGVGRTGTFIAVDYLMQHVSSSDVIDIYGYVMKMRNNRPNMVQTEDQYIFIHDCIRDFINRSDEDDDDENEEGEEEQGNPIYANM